MCAFLYYCFPERVAFIPKPFNSLKSNIMQQIKVPFGFKSFMIGNIVVYTGKIRIKTSADYLHLKLQNHTDHLMIYDCKNQCATLTFSTTSRVLNQQLIDAINNVLREMMHARIDAKYSRRTIEAIDYTDYLPY